MTMTREEYLTDCQIEKQIRQHLMNISRVKKKCLPQYRFRVDRTIRLLLDQINRLEQLRENQELSAAKMR